MRGTTDAPQKRAKRTDESKGASRRGAVRPKHDPLKYEQLGMAFASGSSTDVVRASERDAAGDAPLPQLSCDAETVESLFKDIDIGALPGLKAVPKSHG